MTADQAVLESMAEQLEAIIHDAALCSFAPTAKRPFLNAEIEFISDGYINPKDRKAKQAKVLFMQEGLVRLQMQETLLRSQKVQLTAFMQKTGKGEDRAVSIGIVSQCKRVKGGYDAELELDTMELKQLPAIDLFLNCALEGDFATWNRWCADLTDNLELQELNLQNMTLANFDLCAANLVGSDLTGVDLSNANLSGANLCDCNLSGVRITGADLFGARLPRQHMDLIGASGLVEVESVVLI